MFRRLKAYQLAIDIAIGLVYFAFAFSFHNGPTTAGIVDLVLAVAVAVRRLSPVLSLGEIGRAHV